MARGKGFGEALLQETLRFLKKQKVKKVTWTAIADNPQDQAGLVSFYKKSGATLLVPSMRYALMGITLKHAKR